MLQVPLISLKIIALICVLFSIYTSDIHKISYYQNLVQGVWYEFYSHLRTKCNRVKIQYETYIILAITNHIKFCQRDQMQIFLKTNKFYAFVGGQMYLYMYLTFTMLMRF